MWIANPNGRLYLCIILLGKKKNKTKQTDSYLLIDFFSFYFSFVNFLYSFPKYQVTQGSFEIDICLCPYSIKQMANIYHSCFSPGNALDTQELLYSSLGT